MCGEQELSGEPVWRLKPLRHDDASGKEILERAMGIEPTSSAWEAEVMAIIRRPQSAPFYADFAGLRKFAQSEKPRRSALNHPMPIRYQTA
jgi:hypothetical protein